MIIKKNKKCNITINDNPKNIKIENLLTKHIPELKKYEERGIMFDTLRGNDKMISLEFHTKIEDDSNLDGCINIYLENVKTKEEILKLIDYQLNNLPKPRNKSKWKI